MAVTNTKTPKKPKSTNGSETGNETGSGGVDPTRPIGRGNPPASGMFKEGNEGGGRPPGRNTKTVVLALLDMRKRVRSAKLMADLAEVYGKAPEDLTVREITNAIQVREAFNGSTSAARYLATAAGEMSNDEDML